MPTKYVVHYNMRQAQPV